MGFGYPIEERAAVYDSPNPLFLTPGTVTANLDPFTPALTPVIDCGEWENLLIAVRLDGTAPFTTPDGGCCRLSLAWSFRRPPSSSYDFTNIATAYDLWGAGTAGGTHRVRCHVEAPFLQIVPSWYAADGSGLIGAGAGAGKRLGLTVRGDNRPEVPWRRDNHPEPGLLLDVGVFGATFPPGDTRFRLPAYTGGAWLNQASGAGGITFTGYDMPEIGNALAPAGTSRLWYRSAPAGEVRPHRIILPPRRNLLVVNNSTGGALPATFHLVTDR